MFVDFTKPGTEGYVVKNRTTGARILGVLQADDEAGYYVVSIAAAAPYWGAPAGLPQPTKIWLPIQINRISRRAA